jgi:class 3 adenylate cyclase
VRKCTRPRDSGGRFAAPESYTPEHLAERILTSKNFDAQRDTMSRSGSASSGEVVVRSIGSDLRMDYTAVGQTTHLAARMGQIPGQSGSW